MLAEWLDNGHKVPLQLKSVNWPMAVPARLSA
jgi:hypothetical protein